MTRRRWRNLPVLFGLALAVLAGAPLVLADDVDLNEARLQPGLYPLAPGSHLSPELAHPPVEIDWSMSLRGSLVNDTDGERLELQVLPRGSLSYEGRRSRLEADGEITLTRRDDDEVHVGGFRIGLAGGYALDGVTMLEGGARLQFDRPDPHDPDLADDVIDPADSVSGSADIALTRQFGRLSLTAEGAVERAVYGETALEDGAVRLNGDRNVWGLDTGLRVGYQLTPILEVFGQGTVGRDYFDHPRPGIGDPANATSTAFSAGILGTWEGLAEAEASIGFGRRNFDSHAIDDARSLLYSASLTFTPDETLRLTAGLDNTLDLAGPDTHADARIETAAYADLEYTINSWLRLRASADWYTARFPGTGERETGHSYGAGADYQVNAHTQVSADYGFTQSRSSGEAPEDSHRVTLGVTLER